LRAANGDAVVTYGYDTRGLIVRSEDLSAGVVVTYENDFAGRRTEMQEDVSGSRVSYEYGKMGELLWMASIPEESRAGVRMELDYDAALRETERRFSNGVVRDTVYNEAGRIAGIVHRKERGMQSGMQGGDILEAEAYVYDRDGRRTFTIDETAGITSFSYDEAGRLEEVLYPRDAGVQQSQVESLRRLGMVGALSEPERMAVRNRELAGMLSIDSTERQAIDEALAATMPRRTGRVNYLQPVWGEAYTYDSRGNRSEWKTPFQSVAYRYDAENRMVEAGNVRYEYTATGGIQREGNRLYRLFKPPQVHPRGPQINTAEYPTTFLKTASTLFFPARLYYRIKLYAGEGTEKIRQKPLRVLPAERFRLRAVPNGDFDPHIFQALWIAITA